MRDYKQLPIPETVWKKPTHFIAFGFGIGAVPWAPGTFGTLMGIPFYLLLRPLPFWIYLIVITAIMIASMWISDRVSREIQVHDHPGMCLDEIVGFFFAMLNAPTGWIWIAIGFGLFRLFDILKPWPIRQIDQKVHGGIGIILDDVIAGVFTAVSIHLFAWIVSI